MSPPKAAITKDAFVASIPEPPEAVSTQSGYSREISSFIFKTSSFEEFGRAERMVLMVSVPELDKDFKMVW
jgi:hypothetical protein